MSIEMFSGLKIYAAMLHGFSDNWVFLRASETIGIIIYFYLYFMYIRFYYIYFVFLTFFIILVGANSLIRFFIFKIVHV